MPSQMASTNVFRLTVRLFIIITVISLNNNTVRNEVMVSAHLLLTSLWDVTANVSNPCIVSNISGDNVLFTGSTDHSCFLQIRASEETRIQLQLDGIVKDYAIDSYMYAERKEKLDICSDNYVVFKNMSEACVTNIVARDIQIKLYGPANLTISGTVAGTQPEVCLGDGNETVSETGHNSFRCKDVNTYSDMVMCGQDQMYNSSATGGYGCYIKFDNSCDVILGPREAAYNCGMQNATYSRRIFINYPDLRVLVQGVWEQWFEIQELKLAYNRITKLNNGSFRGLGKLIALNLTHNLFSTLHGGVFEDLISLRNLDLSDNHIVSGMEAGCFQGLSKLTFLTLKRSLISDLVTEQFQGLNNLFYLDLADNNLHTLHEGVFIGLVSLTMLNLDRNQISYVHPGCFHGLNNLKDLHFVVNKVSTLHEGVLLDLIRVRNIRLTKNQISDLKSTFFRGLSQLDLLDLDSNQIISLSEGSFTDLAALRFLDLTENQIPEIKERSFQGLSNVKHLDLRENNISIVHQNAFTDLISLEQLYINRNRISDVRTSSFQSLRSLKILRLGINPISDLNVATFKGLSNLRCLFLGENNMSTLPEGIFTDLANLQLLRLSYNQIHHLNDISFRGLSMLNRLYIDENYLRTLQVDSFIDTKTLELLRLSGNQIHDLNKGCFNGLSKLRRLLLDRNMLTTLIEGVFTDLSLLYQLSLSDNQIHTMGTGCFQGLNNLNVLNLDANLLNNLQADVCTNLSSLKTLYLQDNPMAFITQNTFSCLSWKDLTFHVSQIEICDCFPRANSVACNAYGIKSPYFTCERLLSDTTLVMFMWCIGFSALGGNLFVLIWRNKENKKNKVNAILLCNLAISDSLMGVYMLIMGSADVYFGENFPIQAENWRSSITCRIAGALSIISSEASVLFVMLISIDRLICIWFAFSSRKLTQRSVYALAGVTWLVSAAFGIFPSVLAGRADIFYDNSHVCIGLPLALSRYSTYIPVNEHRDAIYWASSSWIWGTFSTYFSYFGHGYNFDENLPCLIDSDTGRSPCTHEADIDVGQYYSITLFIGLNSLCYLVVLCCYVAIVREVRNSAKQSGRSRRMDEQIRLTAKVSAVVGTDFCCWFPIILLGILVQARVITLSAPVFAWCVTFVIPINSALNPFVYTIPEAFVDYRNERRKKQKRKEEIIKTRGISVTNA